MRKRKAAANPLENHVTHLFVTGGLISECCHLAAFDERMRGELATFDPDAVTCPKYQREEPSA